MVQILDATLREGEQTPGVYFDGHIKLAIADLLDKVGVDIIEAGHPIVTNEIRDAVKVLANRGFNALIGAHSRSLKEDVDIALGCGVNFLGIFYCVSEERLNGVFKKNLSKAIAQITKTIAYAKEKKPNIVIRYTPEDTVRSGFQNVIDASVAAVESGADIISVADTTGYMIPGTKRSLYDFVTRLKTELSKKSVSPKIAVHCHNDRGLALSNALDGYRAGADIIDASILGLGERAGIVDLAQLLVVLTTDFNEKNNWDLKKLPELYHLVSKHSGIQLPATFPVTGENAFTHCAGVHTHAALLNPLHYQSLAPELVGRKTKISLDHMSGIASIEWALEQIGKGDIDKGLKHLILKKVKSVGKRGKTVDLTELKYIVEWHNRQEK